MRNGAIVGRSSGLVGRERERGLIERLLSAPCGGESGVLVIRGEAGIGKTALLEPALLRSGAMRFFT